MLTHKALFPQADPRDPDTRTRMQERAKELRQDIADGGYRSIRLLTADRRALKQVEAWLALPVPA